MVSAVEKEIVQALRDASGGMAFVNKTSAGRLCGFRSKEKTASFLADVPCFQSGKQTMYLINDLARKMHSIRTFKPFG